MRRVIAGFALAVIAVGYLAPLALVASGDTTPVCCRRDGKHRCSMRMSRMEASDDGAPSLRAQLPDCPYRSLLAVPSLSARPQAAAFAMARVPCVRFVSLTNIPVLSIVSAVCDRPRGPPAQLL